MSYIGKTPTPAPLTSSDITDGIITTTKIADSSVTSAKLGSGATNIPYFYGELASDQTLTRNSFTKITGLTNDELDSASAFDGTTFTVPSGQGGKYYLEGVVTGDYAAIGEDGNNTVALIYKNGSEIKSAKLQQGSNENMREITITVSGFFNLSATNTIELYAYTLDANGGNALVQANRTSLMGYKIIE